MTHISHNNGAAAGRGLFINLYDKIIKRELRTFSAMKEYAVSVAKKSNIPDEASHAAIMKAFELIKRLYWGFFADMSFKAYSALWRELVIPDRDFPEAGDLKRVISISNLFVVMIDIHGYTNFCQNAKKNVSQLNALDQVINHDVKNIAAQCRVLCRREGGDEIVAVSASAVSAASFAVCVMDYFARRRVMRAPNVTVAPSKFADALPPIKISCGISGGNTSVPLIITESGELSGFLLNTAARLQTRANELSPKESRIMATKQTQISAEREIAHNPNTIFKNKDIFFFDTDLIAFKGVLLPTCELVCTERGAYKAGCAEELSQLYASVRGAKWEGAIFADTINLLLKTATVLPEKCSAPRVQASEAAIALGVAAAEPAVFDAVVFRDLCQSAYTAFIREHDYPRALFLLRRCIETLESLPEFDRLILDYTRGVFDRYTILIESYQSQIDAFIDENRDEVFTEHQTRAYEAAKRGAAVYEKMRGIGRVCVPIDRKKSLWRNVIECQREHLSLTIYSGKK